MRDIANVWARDAALVVACWSCVGCGGDRAPPEAGTAGAAAGRGGTAGDGGAGGRFGAGGSGGRAASGTGGAPDPMCSEPLPTQPVVCGGQTCTAPAEILMNNACAVGCCLEVGGVATCGVKSTSMQYPAECTLLAVPDPSCPTESTIIDPLGTIGMFAGCCDVALGKCGIVSPVRPGCITQPRDLTLPDPLQSCGGSVDGSADGGADDAGL